MTTLVMNHGETRHVKLKIFNCQNEAFMIMSASFQFKNKNGEIIDEGSVDITDHVLDVVITPPDKENYVLEFTYSIGDETLIDRVEVRVM